MKKVDRGILGARAEQSLERVVRERAEHPLCARTGVGQLRLLFRQAQPLDANRFPSRTRDSHDALHARGKRGCRLMGGQPDKIERDVLCSKDVAEPVGFRQGDEAAVQVNTDTSQREARAGRRLKASSCWQRYASLCRPF